MNDFERGYFEGVYGGNYDRRNPRRKTRPVVLGVLRFVDGGRLLDIGCAYGAFLAEAARSGRFTLHGTDVSEHAVGVARERLAEHDVDLRVGGLFDNGHPDSSMDIVTMFDVIEHIEDLDAAFAEVRRLLAPKGLFVMTVPVYDGPVGRLVRIADKDPTHLHKIGRQDWLCTCAEHRFDVMHWMGVYRYFLAQRIYLHWQTMFWRRNSPAILVYARPR